MTGIDDIPFYILKGVESILIDIDLTSLDKKTEEKVRDRINSYLVDIVTNGELLLTQCEILTLVEQFIEIIISNRTVLSDFK